MTHCSFPRIVTPWLTALAVLAACANETRLGVLPGNGAQGGTGGVGGLGPSAGSGASAACDIDDPTACGSGDKCSVVDVDSGATGCAPAGDAPICATCEADAECPAGTLCTRGACSPWCSAASDCDSGICLDAWGPPPEQATLPGVDTCLCTSIVDPTTTATGAGGGGGSTQVDKCSPFTGAPCAPDEMCAWMSFWACYETSDPLAAPGDPCLPGGPCDLGVCVPTDPMMPTSDGVCAAYCNADAPGTEPVYPCTTQCVGAYAADRASQTKITHGDTWVGYCVPW